MLVAGLVGQLGLGQSPALGMNSDEKLVTQLFDKITPGVVSISKEPPLVSKGEERAPPSIAGSGFVWDQKHIVTNLHVIDNMNQTFVTFLSQSRKTGKSDHTTKLAVVVGTDPVSDVAVLRVGDRPQNDVAVLRVGERPQNVSKAMLPNVMQPLSRGSSSNLLVGQNVFAFGNPFGLEHSLSRGIISGVSRKLESIGGWPINGVIQTDASINPGNSGGPLIDSDGHVIGVNTAILSGSGTFSGVGLAIPIDTVAKNVNSIIAKGFVRRPVLGAVFAPEALSQELQLPGVMVMKVVPGGPAEKAGVRAPRGGRLGDLVVAMDGKAITSTDEVFSILDQKVPGDTLSLSLKRPSSTEQSDAYQDVQLKCKLGVANP